MQTVSKLRSLLFGYRLITVQSLPNETYFFVFQKKNLNISKPFEFKQLAYKVESTDGVYAFEPLWENRARNFDFGVITTVSRQAEAKWEELGLMKIEKI